MDFFYAFFIKKSNNLGCMTRESKKILSISILGIFLSLVFVPVFAEVQSVKTDKTFYPKDGIITFSGTVKDNDVGLVTLVIRDSSGEFVTLTQSQINPDNSYERSLQINNKFQVNGIYTVESFIQNMTAGKTAKFEFTSDGSRLPQTIPETTTPQTETPVTQQTQEQIVVSQPITSQIITIANFVKADKDPQYYIDRYNNEAAYKSWFDTNYPNLTIEEAVGLTQPEQEIVKNTIPGFPDPAKSSQYYLDRYNNEPAYQEWFDRNFPNQSIYEVIGIKSPQVIEQNPIPTIENEVPIISKTEAPPITVQASTVNNNNELSQMLFALGGLGILFGAVYGVKRKVDSNSQQIIENKNDIQKQVNKNSDQISQNRFWLKNKLMNFKKRHAPIEVIKDRLAKGEISVDQYYQLVGALENQ